MFTFKHVSEFRKVRNELRSLELSNELLKKDNELLESKIRLEIYRPICI